MILYLAPDLTDYAVERRVKGISKFDHTLTLAFRRSRHSQDFRPDWPVVELGHVADRSYLARVVALLRAVHRAVQVARSEPVDIIVARNLDMALLGLMCRAARRPSPAFVYEVLDIRPVATTTTLTSRLVRLAERVVLSQSDLLVVSSPAFIDEFYGPRIGYRGRHLLVENRVTPDSLVERPPTGGARKPSTIGWFGTLRCRTSLELLASFAERNKNATVITAGRPSRLGRVFDDRIRDLPNFVHLGEYRAPDDLGELMAKVDLSWAIDLADPNGNSMWLLPNRPYEAAYFGVPSITLAGTYADRFFGNEGKGWSIRLESADVVAIERLLASLEPQALQRVHERICETPDQELVDGGLDVAKELGRTL